MNPRALYDYARIVTLAALPTRDRTLLITGDDRGVVRLWNLATSAPVGDALPSATDRGVPPIVTGTTLDDGRTVLVVGIKGSRDLRVWEPETGILHYLSLTVGVTCLAAVGADLIVGHENGVLAIPLSRQ